MREDVKVKLDQEFLNHRMKNAKIILVIVSVLSLLGIYGYSVINGEKTTVIGTVVSHHAYLHEEGHDLNIMVKIPDRVSLVKVRIPKNSRIKIGSKVELVKTELLLFNYSTYGFFKYAD